MKTGLPIKLAKPAQRALANAGITTLKQFAQFSEKEISGLHGIGENALQSIRQALAENGLKFAESGKK